MTQRAGLTPKREKFAQEIASGKSQADAYRSAFSAKAMRPSTVQAEASRLMANHMVSARVAELRAPIVAGAQITLESHLADLKLLRDLAAKADQYSAAVAAEVARAKHAGITAPLAVEAKLSGGVMVTVPAAGPKDEAL